jgi:hypothetical protein
MRRVSPRGASHPPLISPAPGSERVTTGDTASMVVSKPLAWIRRRRATAFRYEIRSGPRSDPRDLHLLERAFARLGVHPGERVTGVQVSSATGCLVVAMDVIGPPSHAEGECERLFAIAWYDAFGVRGGRYVGRLVEGPTSS